MFKKIILPVLILFTMASEAAELKTFPEVAEALKQGSELVFVLSLKDCQAETQLSDLKVSVKPNTFMLIGDKRVTASDKHFTLNEPRYPDRAIIDYAKYDINADGSAELRMTVMDARDYQVLVRNTINCELGKSFQVFSAK
ncbi:MAG: VirK protein [Tatlockia sp.]|nr:VirK protein [Tatlockia sp.]